MGARPGSNQPEAREGGVEGKGTCSDVPQSTQGNAEDGLCKGLCAPPRPLRCVRSGTVNSYLDSSAALCASAAVPAAG